MKRLFLAPMLLAGWLASPPAYATTYTYDVNYSFTSIPGTMTGVITTSCDNCELDSSNILSWSFKASDGTSGSSSDPGSGISTTDFMLEAMPTGIFTVANPAPGASIRFCSDISGGGADCFHAAGLDVHNIDHGPPSPVTWFINWVENSGAEPTFSTNGFGFSPDPSIEIASLAVPEPPVWAMIIIGFAGLGFAAARRRRCDARVLTA